MVWDSNRGTPKNPNPFHKGILGIQTTGPQTNNWPLANAMVERKNRRCKINRQLGTWGFFRKHIFPFFKITTEHVWNMQTSKFLFFRFVWIKLNKFGHWKKGWNLKTNGPNIIHQKKVLHKVHVFHHFIDEIGKGGWRNNLFEEVNPPFQHKKLQSRLTWEDGSTPHPGCQWQMKVLPFA